MPARKALPVEDHIARFVPYARQQRDPDTDAFLGLLPIAMELSAEDKGGLSVTWIEHFGPFGLVTKRSAATAYRASLESKRLGGKGIFATAQVSKVLEVGSSFDKHLRVVHDPILDNPGHAEVRHFTDDDLRLLDVLASAFDDFDTVASLKLP